MSESARPSERCSVSPLPLRFSKGRTAIESIVGGQIAAGGYTPTMLSPVAEKELPPADYVINGQQLIGVTVLR